MRGVRNPDALERRVPQEHRETGTEDLVNAANPAGLACPSRCACGRHPAQPSDCCLRRCRKDLAGPPLGVIDGPFPPMADALSPGGQGEGLRLAEESHSPSSPGQGVAAGAIF